jgi:hypothetical protein
MFAIEDGREKFYQWDKDRRLIVNDKSITEVHFCNRTDTCSLIVETYEEDNKIIANVPNLLLTNAWKIHVYGYDKNHTKFEKCFDVVSRTKPADYIYTETEIKNYDDLAERIKALEEKEVEPAIKNIVDGAGECSVRLKDAQEITERHGVALGYGCYSGKASFSAGYNNTSLGYGGAVFGTRNTGDGWGVLVAGQDNNVNGAVNAVFGSGNTVEKTTNFVSGGSNKVNGDNNNVMGITNEASGNGNIISGKNIKAYTNNNVMFGNGISGAKAGGAGGGIAIGNTLYAQQDKVVAIGNGLVTGKAGQTVLGQWNNPNGADKLIIGVGAEGARANGIVIDKDNNTKFAGSVIDGNGNSFESVIKENNLKWVTLEAPKSEWGNTTYTREDGSIGIYYYFDYHYYLTVKGRLTRCYPLVMIETIEGLSHREFNKYMLDFECGVLDYGTTYNSEDNTTNFKVYFRDYSCNLWDKNIKVKLGFYTE